MKSDVNVLVGINGTGKSSLLNLLGYCLSPKDDSEIAWHNVVNLANEVVIVFESGSIIRANLLNFILDTSEGKNVREFISLNKADLEQIIDTKTPVIVKTFDNSESLDSIIGEKNEQGNYSGLLGHFFNYRNEKIAIVLDNGGNLAEESRDIYALYDIIDKYFGDSDKTISRSFRNKEFLFEPTHIGVDKLSSGEKQLLVLFLATFLQHQKETFLLLDEPETSLHTLWQENLFNDLLSINPNCQLIIVTHAPSTFDFDWGNNRVRMNEIIFPDGTLEAERTTPQENNFDRTYLLEVQNLLTFIDEETQITYQTTYEINVRLKNFNLISFAHALEILTKMISKKIKIDLITVTTLINRVSTSLDEARKLIISPLQPNDYVFNSLLKKANSVAEGVQFIAEFMNEYSHIKADILTFSTLLSKARNQQEVEEVEELRRYHNVKANELYNKKLHIKQSKPCKKL